MEVLVDNTIYAASLRVLRRQNSPPPPPPPPQWFLESIPAAPSSGDERKSKTSFRMRWYSTPRLVFPGGARANRHRTVCRF